jgi:predicted phosphodiesterase
MKNDVILLIPDTHAPFMHPQAVDFLREIKKEYKPNRIFQMGDLIDQFAFSKFARDPDTANCDQELERALDQLGDLYDLFPKVEMCIGNHDNRIMKRAAEAGISKKFIKELKDIYQLPKDWIVAENFRIPEMDLMIMHGEGFSGRGAMVQLLQTFRRNAAIGHLHGQAGTFWLSNGSPSWVLATGCLVDPRAYAFKYSQFHKDQPILGCGVIVGGTPLFHPM